jgi:hypothetical protein
VFGGDNSDAPEECQQHRTRAREQLVQRLTLTLRLTREDPVYDPTQFITYRRCNGLNIRDPRRYGRAAYNFPETTRLEPGDLPHLEHVFHALDTFDSFRDGGPLVLATRLFQSSYDLSPMESRDRVLLLLGALEALTDGKEHPLRSIRWPEERLKQFLERFRQKRNEIAHGAEAGGEADVSALRQIVRCLICEGIAIELMAPGQERSSGLPLLRGMKDLTTFGSARLADARMTYDGGWSTAKEDAP